MEKIKSVIFLVLLVITLLSSLTANAVLIYRSSNVALIVAQQNGYQSCVNQVNAEMQKQQQAQVQPQSAEVKE